MQSNERADSRFYGSIVSGNQADVSAEFTLLSLVPSLSEIDCPHKKLEPFIVDSPFRNQDRIVHQRSNCVRSVELEELAYAVGSRRRQRLWK